MTYEEFKKEVDQLSDEIDAELDEMENLRQEILKTTAGKGALPASEETLELMKDFMGVCNRCDKLMTQRKELICKCDKLFSVASVDITGTLQEIIDLILKY